MKPEYEAKFLIHDADTVRNRLRNLEAECIYPERTQRRINWDYEDKKLATVHGWVRLRDEGEGKVTLTYKQNNAKAIDGVLESEISVSDFEHAKQFLHQIGLRIKSEQETRRERWMLSNVEIDIDTWPWLDPFVEVEGHDAESVAVVAEALGFDMQKALFGPVNSIYTSVYDVERSEVSHAMLSFAIPCPWKKRI